MKRENIRERFVKLGRKRLDDVVLAHIFNEVETITDLDDCIDLFCLLHMEYSDELSCFEMNVLTYIISEYDKLLNLDERFQLYNTIPYEIKDMLDIVDCCEYDEYYMSDYDYDDGRYSIYDVYSPAELGIRVSF